MESPSGVRTGSPSVRPERPAEVRVLDEVRAARVVEAHLEEIDAAGRAAREAAGRGREAHERVASEAQARREALPHASGLDLDHDQGAALDEDQIQLGPARAQAAREEAPAARAQGAFDQALARQREGRIVGAERAQREARRDAREEPARAGPERRGAARAAVPGTPGAAG